MGFLAHRLEKIRKESEFFVWFHLKEDGSPREEGKKRIFTFKPTGEAFRELVTITFTVNGEDRIREIELVLARSFVDDAVNGIFARDIAKSLLRAAIPRENQTEVAGLADEIEVLVSRGRPASSALRKKPGSQTLGYQVYLGKEKRYEQVLSRCIVRLENFTDALKISLSSRESPG